MANKIKYPKSIETEVLNWVAEGKSLRELHALDPAKYPSASLVSKWAVSRSDFREAYHKAKWEALYKSQDELNWLVSHPPKLLVDAADARELNILTTQWKQKIASIEKYISKFAGIYDTKLNNKEMISIENTGVPQMQVLVLDFNSPEASSLLPTLKGKYKDTYIQPLIDPKSDN